MSSDEEHVEGFRKLHVGSSNPYVGDVIIRNRWQFVPQHVCWKPESPHSLRRPGSNYVELDSISRVLHLDDFKPVFESGRFIPYPITNKSHTSLPVGLLCCWFGVPPAYKHTWFGNVGCQVDFNTFLEMFNPKCYLVEVVQFRTSSATRLLFTTQDAEYTQSLTEYEPTTSGGPWFKDGNGKHWFLSDSRRYKNEGINMHSNKLEIIIVLSEKEFETLYQICKVVPVYHFIAGVNLPMNCKKFGSRCPYPWSTAECYEELKTRFPMLVEQNKLFDPFNE